MSHDAAFEPTKWSTILAAGNVTSPDARSALAELCDRYWPPVYAYVLRRVGNVHQAEDLTQDFFQHVFEKNLIGLADADRGRFRSFLLTSLVNFLNNAFAKQRAQKRGGDRRQVPLEFAFDTVRASLPISAQTTPEKAYERQWALCLLGSTLHDLGEEMAASGKRELFEHLKAYLTQGGDQRTYAQVGTQTNMSADAIKLQVFRLRKRFGQLLRQSIRQTVATSQDVDEEIQRLFAVLGSTP